MSNVKLQSLKNGSIQAALLLFVVLVVALVYLFLQNRALLEENRNLSNVKNDFYAKHVSNASTTFFPGLNSKDIHLLINAERKKAGIHELAYNEQLQQSACAKLDDMIAKDYWAHMSPEGTQPWYFMNQVGIVYRYAGENLGYGFANADALVQGWMNSPKHKENIVNPTYSAEGICVRTADLYQGKTNQTVIVQHFYREL